MDWMILAFLIVVLLLLTKRFSFGQREDTSDSTSKAHAYIKVDALFTPAERSFLGVLDQALGDEYRIFGKVRVGDLITTRQGITPEHRRSARNKIDRKHFDFVVCHRHDLSVLCVIELNDKSHHRTQRRNRDTFLSWLCNETALPLIQVRAQHAYSVADVRARILALVDKTSTNGAASSTAAVRADAITPSNDPDAPVALPPEAHAPATEFEVPQCPRCSSTMVWRKARTGSWTGREFWGCSRFPECRGTVQPSRDDGPFPTP